MSKRVVKISKLFKTKDEYELELSFTLKAHCGPVRSLVGVNKFVISGGSDNLCKVSDMSKRVESGVLNHHEGTVSCLTGFGKKFLLTGSDDNSLSILRVGSWQIEKTLYKHTAGITCLAVHPTGKLAFTAGKDKKLITWNLVKARPAFITNIKGIAEFITVSPDGGRYAVGVHRRVDIYNIETAGIEYTIDIKARPNCLVFLNNDTVVVGGESSSAQIHSLIEKKLLRSWEVHTTRVRCMLMLGERMLVTASSSDSMIKIWNVSTNVAEEIACIGSVDTTCRVTCMSIWHKGLRVGGKRKAGKVEETETVSPRKKIKITETEASKKVETITVEQEFTTVKKKLKKVGTL